MIATALALSLLVAPDLPTALRNHVSYLASDDLQGRGTPSAGLDKASEYIAGQFSEIGLDRPVDGTYFQVSKYRDKPVRNVIGVLKGTDPKLANEYIIVSAHYDHLGVRTPLGDPDPGTDLIFNGANDDASGTAGVIEVARALKANPPRRSVAFLLFWGEELGMMGSSAYLRNPVIPLAQTVANVNLEQIGRTDDSEGKRENAVSVTGFDFSDLPAALTAAAKPLAMRVEKHPRFSDAYFGASDNYVFARKGIVAHTVCTAFAFPDYHAVGDEAGKLDYANMAKVVLMVSGGVGILANADAPPAWSADNPKTERFRDAAKALHTVKQ